MLKTESPSDDHAELDLYPTPDLVRALVDDQDRAVQAVRDAAPLLARAVDAALPRLRAGGRLIYAGAGTSGRLGLLDSVELNPTFSWPPERALALIAGGRGALFEAVEGAEDDREQGALDMRLHEPGPTDVLSFPMDELRPPRDGEEPPAGEALHASPRAPTTAKHTARSTQRGV